MKNTVILIFLIALIGCTKSEQEKLNDEKKSLDIKVQNIVRDNLKDGDSAKFQNQINLCGEVNAKNSFGAYTGYQRYIVTTDKIYFENEFNSDTTSINAFNQVWDAECKN